jgi:hypothetical protein
MPAIPVGVVENSEERRGERLTGTRRGQVVGIAYAASVFTCDLGGREVGLGIMDQIRPAAQPTGIGGS